jgi:hypothetical protein
VLIININYKKTKNHYDKQDKVALITVLKKNGDQLVAKIDAEDIEKVQSMGTWFAEWHKDFNSYLVQNISEGLVDGKSKDVKHSLQSVIMGTSSKTPIKHINGDTLDNRKSNLEIVQRNSKNDYKVINEKDVAILLKDKYGKIEEQALISREDLTTVVSDEYSWVYYKRNGRISVVANTPNGRVYLDEFIMKPDDNMIVHHINLNPLDNRRSNLENKLIELGDTD